MRMAIGFGTAIAMFFTTKAFLCVDAAKMTAFQLFIDAPSKRSEQNIGQ
jgi:hypothetical protein